jgi:hypothetical protein
MPLQLARADVFATKVFVVVGDIGQRRGREQALQEARIVLLGARVTDGADDLAGGARAGGTAAARSGRRSQRTFRDFDRRRSRRACVQGRGFRNPERSFER